jgi:DNA invertase Pin-like site-specific DNA recombinase
VSGRSRLCASHLRRQAFVYVRQSTQAQLERNVESTERQYALVERAVALGFAREQVVVIDEDLGVSGSGLSERSGFARLTAEVALGHAGLVLGLEASRLARNNVDWYRLLDLCGVTDTVIGDADGLYHPGSFNDRLLLGLKGTMSEAELHTLRARRPLAGRGCSRPRRRLGFPLAACGHGGFRPAPESQERPMTLISATLELHPDPTVERVELARCGTPACDADSAHREDRQSCAHSLECDLAERAQQRTEDRESAGSTEVERPGAVEPARGLHGEAVVLEALIDLVDALLGRLDEADVEARGIAHLRRLANPHQGQHQSVVVEEHVEGLVGPPSSIGRRPKYLARKRRVPGTSVTVRLRWLSFIPVSLPVGADMRQGGTALRWSHGPRASRESGRIGP